MCWLVYGWVEQERTGEHTQGEVGMTLWGRMSGGLITREVGIMTVRQRTSTVRGITINKMDSDNAQVKGLQHRPWERGHEQASTCGTLTTFSRETQQFRLCLSKCMCVPC